MKPLGYSLCISRACARAHKSSRREFLHQSFVAEEERKGKIRADGMSPAHARERSWMEQSAFREVYFFSAVRAPVGENERTVGDSLGI